MLINFKDRILYKYTQSSIEIDIIVVKKHMLFIFRWKILNIKMKIRQLMLL